MEHGCLEILLKGPINTSDGSFAKLSQKLQDYTDCNIIELEKALSTSSAVSLIRSPDEETLASISTVVRSAGGKVLRVRTGGERAALVVDTDIEITLPSLSKPHNSFEAFFNKYSAGIMRTLQALNIKEVSALVDELVKAREEDRQIFVIGNGGSAATASHLVTDLAKERFQSERSLFRIMSLNDNAPWLTATANDFGYDAVFANQLKNLMRPGDVVLLISSSGNSPNILAAADYANKKGAITWGIVGFGGGQLKGRVQRSIDIPSKRGQYGYMEDVTSIISHMLSIYIYEQDSKRFE